MNIAVIGGSGCSKSIAAIAKEVGRLIAQQGWVLICGGNKGVMQASCQGAKEYGGITVGILSGYDKKDANQYLTVKIPTGIGYARNFLVIRAADAVIAVGGKYGTLSEISFALVEKKCVLGINTWPIKGIRKVANAQAAINYIKRNIS